MFLDEDPWTSEFFLGVDSYGIGIPCSDTWAWELLPKYRWLYNKMEICKTQNIPAHPDGMNPPKSVFPVICRPIINLYGMGCGIKVCQTFEEWDKDDYSPGHFWMPYFEGLHLSMDLAVSGGVSRWFCLMQGMDPHAIGVFDYWQIRSLGGLDDKSLGRMIDEWIANHLPDYTGMLNIELIGNRIIEVHPRMSSQFVDLYGGRRWVESVANLYKTGAWDSDFCSPSVGYSVVLWTQQDGCYSHAHLPHLSHYGVSSIQYTFEDVESNLNAERLSEYPGDGKNFRLAIINDSSREKAFRVREKLQQGIHRKLEPLEKEK